MNSALTALVSALGDRTAAAKAAVGALAAAPTPLGDIARTPLPQLTPRPEPTSYSTAGGARRSMAGVSPITSSGKANPEFVRRLQALIAATGGAVSVQGGNWGYRTNAQQAALYRQKPNLAAPPGRSNHERGTAADLSGNLAAAHRLAAQYGLRFPMLTRAPGKKFEPWHVELA